MKIHRYLTHAVVLAIAVAISGYASLDRHYQSSFTASLGAVNAEATVSGEGGAVGDVTQRSEGVPAFAEGDEYVVFLYGVSSAGFSSPVGLAQGQFVVRNTPNGRMVSNGLDFRRLLKDQKTASFAKSTVALSSRIAR